MSLTSVVQSGVRCSEFLLRRHLWLRLQTQSHRRQGWFFRAVSTDGSILSVKLRRDRATEPLVSFYEGTKQLLQVVQSHFASEAEAVQFMVRIAEQYAAGQVPKEQLKALRDSTMPRRLMKRPAAPAAEVSSKKAPATPELTYGTASSSTGIVAGPPLFSTELMD
jgi:hypothetical protein